MVATNPYNSPLARQIVADTWNITIPTENEILFYRIENDSPLCGDRAFVLFRRVHGLFEVDDSYCACDGFANWDPKPTSVAALLYRIQEGDLGSCEGEDWADELRDIILLYADRRNIAVDDKYRPKPKPLRVPLGQSVEHPDLVLEFSEALIARIKAQLEADASE